MFNYDLISKKELAVLYQKNLTWVLMRHKCHKADDLMKAIEKVILHIRMCDVTNPMLYSNIILNNNCYLDDRMMFRSLWHSFVVGGAL